MQTFPMWQSITLDTNDLRKKGIIGRWEYYSSNYLQNETCIWIKSFKLNYWALKGKMRLGPRSSLMTQFSCIIWWFLRENNNCASPLENRCFVGDDWFTILVYIKIKIKKLRRFATKVIRLISTICKISGISENWCLDNQKTSDLFVISLIIFLYNLVSNK